MFVLFQEFASAAIPIFSLVRDRRRLGYKEVSAQIVWVSGGWAWSIACQDFGLSGCRPPAGLVLHDQSEEQFIIDLIDYADVEFDNGNIQGAFQKRILVYGEPKERIYTLIWNFDKEGKGTININLED